MRGFSGSRISAVLAAIGLMALSAPDRAAAQTKWDLSMEDRGNSLPGEGATAFAEEVKTKSDGKIVITVHHGGALGLKNKDHLTAVRDGVVPLAQSLAGAFAGQEPLFLLSSLPFVARSLDEAKLLYDVARPDYEKALAKNGQMLLYSSPFPPTGIWAKKATTSLADLSGMKVRTYDVNGTITFKNAGAAPLQVSFSDVIPQLSTGNINAALTSADGGRSMKFWEFLSHFNNVGYAFPLNVTTINKAAFDGLSPELQKVVKDAALAAETRDWTAVRNWEAKNNEVLKENKVTIVSDFTPQFLSELGKAGEPALTDWLGKTGAPGKQIMDTFNTKAGRS